MKNRKRDLTPQEFREIYSKVPRVTVEVVVLYENKVVLIKRQEDSWNGQLHIPGGSVLYKEHLTDAVKRVSKEEINIEIEIITQNGYIEYPSEEFERGFGWSIGIVFVCKPISNIDINKWSDKGIALYSHLPTNLIKEQRSILENILNKVANNEYKS